MKKKTFWYTVEKRKSYNNVKNILGYHVDVE